MTDELKKILPPCVCAFDDDSDPVFVIGKPDKCADWCPGCMVEAMGAELARTMDKQMMKILCVGK